jgi:hypothetical protein
MGATPAPVVTALTVVSVASDSMVLTVPRPVLLAWPAVTAAMVVRRVLAARAVPVVRLAVWVLRLVTTPKVATAASAVRRASAVMAVTVWLVRPAPRPVLRARPAGLAVRQVKAAPAVPGRRAVPAAEVPRQGQMAAAVRARSAAMVVTALPVASATAARLEPARAEAPAVRAASAVAVAPVVPVVRRAVAALVPARTPTAGTAVPVARVPSAVAVAAV